MKTTNSRVGDVLGIGGVLLLAAAAASISLAAGFARGQEEGDDGTPPNVVLILTDDQGYGDIAAHGNTMIRTPNLDRLHAESIRLTDFHVDPTCSPTRAALMSGRYSTRTGVWHTIMGLSLMSSREVTLAEVFSANGYRTGIFGKWHLGDNYPCRPGDQGFDEAFVHGGGGVGQGPDYWGNDYFDDTYFRNGTPEKAEGYCTDVWFDSAIEFIEANKDRPFFAYISTNAPHAPYNVDEKYSRPYLERGVAPTMAKFYGMIANIDENVGRLRAELERLDLAENTILIFMTDNGSSAGRRRARNETGTWDGFNASMRAGKGSEYEGGHRVPFFIRWPRGRLGRPRDIDRLTAHIDVLPTLAGLCGIELDGDLRLDGSNLAPLLRGNETNPTPRTLFVHSQRVVDPEKWRKSSVMTERWRLVRGTELYDIELDPGQKRDVAADHPRAVEKLRAAYEEWWESLTPVFDEMVHIEIGSLQEPRTQFHPHDLHVESGGATPPWHQDHVRRGEGDNGFWAVDVVREGRYSVTLRRWPEHVGGSLGAAHYRIAIDGIEVERDLGPDEEYVEVMLGLRKGKTRLQTWLTDEAGTDRPAYFVYVERERVELKKGDGKE